jgi:N-acetylmuramoyl-L-alanine amidase
MRQINEIFIHCSATQPKWMAANSCQQKVEEIRRWHKDKGWSDIGYHLVVDRQGDVCAGRPVERVGAHAKGHNKNSIGICLIGGFGSDADDKFEEHYTDLQRKALDNLIKDLTDRHSNAKIRGHNEISFKACPGFRVKEYLDGQSKAKENTEEGSSSPTVSSPTLVDLLMGLLRKLIGG